VSKKKHLEVEKKKREREREIRMNQEFMMEYKK
jgi:hypothetical protein